MSDFQNPYSQSDAQPNPYAPAVISSGDPTVGSRSEQIRKQHLSHEASVKSIGILYILGGLAGIGFGIMFIVQALDGTLPGEAVMITLIVGIVCLLLSAFQLMVAVGLRKLAPWVKIPGMILAGIGLLGFPVGTLINGYILYLLASAKGTMVLSPEYKKIIAETPHIKYKTSIVIWILLGLLGFVILLAIFGALVG